VAKQFGAGYVRQPTRPDGGYAVDHSSQTYVVDRDGRWWRCCRWARRRRRSRRLCASCYEPPGRSRAGFPGRWPARPLPACFVDAARLRAAAAGDGNGMAALVAQLRLTDLALFTEARYTRHPSQADLHSAFQDHPLALEHFPTGSLIGPPAGLTDSRLRVMPPASPESAAGDTATGEAK
jgi:hypothetical protein